MVRRGNLSRFVAGPLKKLRGINYSVVVSRAPTRAPTRAPIRAHTLSKLTILKFRAQAVAAPAEQQVSGAAEVGVPPEVAYALQVEREFGRDPRLGPPPPPTLASPLAARPAQLPSPHRHCPAVDRDGTREAG